MTTETTTPEVVQTPTEQTTATAPVAAQPVATPSPVAEAPMADEVKTEPLVEENYGWFPKKYLDSDGKPDYKQLAKAHQSLEKKFSSKGAFAPDSLDEYVFQQEGIELDAEEEKQFKEFAKELGLSAGQYPKLLAKHIETLEAVSLTPEKAQKHLQEVWGDRYEEMGRNVAKAFEVAVPSHIPKDAIGNNPYILEILAHIGSEMHEDTVTSKSRSSVGGIRTEADVDAAMASPDYWKNPDKQKAVKAWFEKQ